MNQRILIVDDEPDLTALFCEVFKNAGHEVRGYTDPIKAYKEFMRNHDKYWLVITDVRMPGMSGVELATKVKEKFSKTKIILISAFEIEYINLNNMKRIDYFVSKPISMEKLLDIVNIQFKGHKHARRTLYVSRH